jgi:hypothetical protein
LVEALHAWLTELLGRLSGRSSLAQAIRYALNHWNGLIRFLDDGRFELDTNIVERAMRPVALGRNYPHLRIMCSSPRRYRKRRACGGLSASSGTVHSVHNSDLLAGPFYQTGGQNGRRDHHPAAAA